jgi:hypothetical protein
MPVSPVNIAQLNFNASKIDYFQFRTSYNVKAHRTFNEKGQLLSTNYLQFKKNRFRVFVLTSIFLKCWTRMLRFSWHLKAKNKQKYFVFCTFNKHKQNFIFDLVANKLHLAI